MYLHCSGAWDGCYKPSPVEMASPVWRTSRLPREQFSVHSRRSVRFSPTLTEARKRCHRHTTQDVYASLEPGASKAGGMFVNAAISQRRGRRRAQRGCGQRGDKNREKPRLLQIRIDNETATRKDLFLLAAVN